MTGNSHRQGVHIGGGITFPEEAGAQPDILALILRNAVTRPSSLAVRDGKESLTYMELCEQARQIAAGLSSFGVSPGDRVGIHLADSAAFVAVALGCLWLGAPFVPLAVTDPPARTARLIEDCRATVVVRPDGTEVERGPAGQCAPAVGVTLEALMRNAGRAPERSRDPERDAYVMYTSGTTGRPKGVRVPVSAFSWCVSRMAERFLFNDGTRAVSALPFHFDGAYVVVWPTLVAGGSLVVASRDELVYLKWFFRALQDEGITHTICTPRYLSLLASSPRLQSLGSCLLRVLLVGGEQFGAGAAAKLWAVLPGVRIFNCYGPTETTIMASSHEVTPAELESGTVPIGTPLPGLRFSLTDADGTPCGGEGQAGELYIGGDQLMRGYWGDQTLSGQVLRRDIVDGEVMYQTGDLVYRDHQGEYVYVGRLNDVIKRAGVRVSLEEICEVLRRVRGVRAAVCLPVERGGKLGITAVVEAGPEVTEQTLLDAAAAELPASMCPDETFVLGRLPLNNSGKLDRQRLLADVKRTEWHGG